MVREPTDVMLVRVADQLPEIQRAWASFEAAVGLRGRKFYGAFDPVSATYSVCAVLRPGDDPSEFGAEQGVLPGGRYACVRLQGEPPCLRGDRPDGGATRAAAGRVPSKRLGGVDIAVARSRRRAPRATFGRYGVRNLLVSPLDFAETFPLQVVWLVTLERRHMSEQGVGPAEND